MKKRAYIVFLMPIILLVAMTTLVSCSVTAKSTSMDYDNYADYYLKNRYKPETGIASPFSEEYKEKMIEELSNQ